MRLCYVSYQYHTKVHRGLKGRCSLLPPLTHTGSHSQLLGRCVCSASFHTRVCLWTGVGRELFILSFLTFHRTGLPCTPRATHTPTFTSEEQSKEKNQTLNQTNTNSLQLQQGCDHSVIFKDNSDVALIKKGGMCDPSLDPVDSFHSKRLS